MQGELFIYQSGQMVSTDFLINFVFQFLDEISSNVSKESSGLEDAVVLKEGWVFVHESGQDQGKELMAAAVFALHPYQIWENLFYIFWYNRPTKAVEGTM